MEKVSKVLLKKAGDTNSFINEEADAAISELCRNCQETKVLGVLLVHSQIKATAIRIKVSKALGVLVENLDNNILFFKESDKLLALLGANISDASQDVRNLTKQAFLSIQNSVISKKDLEKLLLRSLNE